MKMHLEQLVLGILGRKPEFVTLGREHHFNIDPLNHKTYNSIHYIWLFTTVAIILDIPNFLIPIFRKTIDRARLYVNLP